MSNTYPPVPPQDENLPPLRGGDTAPGIDTQNSSSGDAQGKAATAKEQASELGGTASEAGQKVTEAAKDEASKVASEAKGQAKDVFREAQGQLTEQAGEQQKKVATGLRSISDELRSMANNSEGEGMATDLVHQAASKAGNVASWLDDRDPGALLDEVRRFARERPGAFIGIAAAAGVLAGRLTRSLTSGSDDHEESSGRTGTRVDDRSGSGGTAAHRDQTGTSAYGTATGEWSTTASPVYDATLGASRETGSPDSLGRQAPTTEPGTTSPGLGQL